jgi:hypothetical protein
MKPRRSRTAASPVCPTTFIINRHGIIADVYQGPVGRTALQNDLKKLL